MRAPEWWYSWRRIPTVLLVAVLVWGVWVLAHAAFGLSRFFNVIGALLVGGLLARAWWLGR